MNFKKVIKTSMAGLLLYFTLGVVASWAQDRVIPLLFRDGKPVDLLKSYSVEEIKAGIMVNQVPGFEVYAIYQVRENRPVKAVKFKSQQDLQAFDLYGWGMGKQDGGKAVASDAGPRDIQPGDRFAFDSVWNGKPLFFNFTVK